MTRVLSSCFWNRRTTGALALLAYLFAAYPIVSFPPFKNAASKGDDRYPCEAGSCGCASAEECWTHCCCLSEHERLVWAISQGVPPPAGVEFTEQQWLDAADAARPGAVACGRCLDRVKADLSDTVAVAGSNSCGTTADRGNPADSKSPAESAKAGLCLSPLGCKGVKPVVSSADLSAIFHAPLALPEKQRHSLVPPDRNIRPSSRSLDISPPPPKSA